MRLVFWFVVAAGAYWYFLADRIRCDEYASRFTCKHLEEDALYDVFYWVRVQDDDPSNERVIATVTGLQACKNAALGYSAQIGEPWNERAYVCALKRDGGYAEKHRWLR